MSSFRGGIALGVAALLSAGGATALGVAATTARADTATSTTKFNASLPLRDRNGSNTGAAEPSIAVDRGGHVYVSGPVGVPTGGCPLWRVHPDVLGTNNLPYDYLGTFDTDHGSVGGGDCDIATGGRPAVKGYDNLAVSSLSLANLTTNQSSNGGTTLHTPANTVGQQVFGVDRQWNASDQGLRQVYMTVHDAATSNIQFASSTDGGFTYVSNTPAIDATHFPAAQNDNHFGTLVVNPRTHKIYTVYVAPADAAENAAAQASGDLNEHVVYLAVGDPCAVTPCTPGSPIGPVSWTDQVVYSAPTGTDLAHDFPAIAIDRGGAVYISWSDTHHIYLTHSANPDQAGTWSAPVRVDPTSSHSNMFPWIVAGQSGAVDVTWYGSTLDPTVCPPNVPTDDSNGVANNCHNVWRVKFAQTFNGLDAVPTFTRFNASGVNHYGSICDQGLNCNLFGGDRTLLDFFDMDLGPLGEAHIAYASDVASPGTAQIMYTRQCEGLSAKTGLGIALPCGSLAPAPPKAPGSVCSGTNVVTDPAGDATNPSGGGGTTDQVDITNIAFSYDGTNHTLTTTMRLNNLSLTPLTGTADTYYYVAWSFNGKVYATLVQEPGPDTTAYSYGEFDPGNNQLTTSNAATGSFVAGPNGTVSVTVPLSGIGNPTIPSSTSAGAAVINPYGVTVSGIGVLGNGLVFTHPDDRAPTTGFGPRWSVC